MCITPCNFLITIAHLNDAINLRENTLTWEYLLSVEAANRLFIIKKKYENATNFITHNHHSIKGSRAISFDKLTSTEMYFILISKVQNKLVNVYFESLFDDLDID